MKRFPLSPPVPPGPKLLWLFVVLFLGQVPAPAAVTFVEQAERLQLIYAHLLDFRPNSAPYPVEQTQWEIGGDILILPVVNNRIGDKKEKIEAPPVIPRPRVRFLHDSGLFAGGSWTPPVEVKQYKMNLFSLEGGYRYAWGDRLLAGRGIFSSGFTEGPITEQATTDTFHLQRTALDLSVGYRYQDWIGYGGFGSGTVDSELEIQVDGVKMKLADHTYLYGLVGISYFRKPWVWTVEQDQSETFLRHTILSVAYQF